MSGKPSEDDRARVTRRGTVHLEVGTHELAVGDLTLQLDPESVRVSGEGTAQVRMLGVDVRREYYTETPSATAAELEHQLEEKQDADQALQDEVALPASQLGMLGSMSEHAGEQLSRGIGRGRAKLTDGTALLSFLGTQHTQFSARKRELAVQRRDQTQTEGVSHLHFQNPALNNLWSQLIREFICGRISVYDFMQRMNSQF